MTSDGGPVVAWNPRRLIAVLAAASVVFALTTLEAANDPPASWETTLFQAVNGLPDRLYVVVWPFMQYGVVVTIPIAALAAWALRRRRLAALLAVAGIAIYVLAKVVKRVVDRGRPSAFIDTMAAREHFANGSIGYTSGHAAVAATIATITVAYLPRPWRDVTVALVAIVAFGRMYVGAHLPLDLIGGIAMGIMAGTLALLVSGLLDHRREQPEPFVTFDPDVVEERREG